MQYRTAHEKRYFTTAMRCINIRKKDAYAGMPVYNNGLKSAEIM